MQYKEWTTSQQLARIQKQLLFKQMEIDQLKASLAKARKEIASLKKEVNADKEKLGRPRKYDDETAIRIFKDTKLFNYSSIRSEAKMLSMSPVTAVKLAKTGAKLYAERLLNGQEEIFGNEVYRGKQLQVLKDYQTEAEKPELVENFIKKKILIHHVLQ